MAFTANFSDIGVWEAILDGPGTLRSSATVTGTPEGGVLAAMARAMESHGPQDWSTWRFRAEWLGQPALRTVHFRWSGGELVRLAGHG